MIGISNALSFFFIESSWYLLLYAVALGVFIINNWRYEYDFVDICFFDYLLVFYTILILIGSFIYIKVCLKRVYTYRNFNRDYESL
ncbi:unnamed protein product [Blepharisma stoltei]|uniref:NADH dehydrogenase subunit 6 n=1 Tax=Blepharisma stoltei TaxID=1481888 RepID=A0AAU9J5Z6_9CILI|nr:unnamed protein product [Blepharisma stoltei]